MDFRLTPEQEQFRDSVIAFSRKHLAPGARERAHASGYPWDVAKLMAGQGLLGITIPAADGGQGGSLMDAVIAIESVASVCPRSADVIQAGNFGPIRVLAEYGSASQKKKFLSRLLSGEKATECAPSIQRSNVWAWRRVAVTASHSQSLTNPVLLASAKRFPFAENV